MFVSDRVVFLELHKTGCTQIRALLSTILQGQLSRIHDQATHDLFTEGRAFLGSVRNPWSWYTSLWAYGCDSKGVLFENVTRHRGSIRGLGWKRTPIEAFIRMMHLKDPAKWKAAYRDVTDAAAFRDWLHMMHDHRYFDAVGEGYHDCPASRHVGLMTFRYLTLFCIREGEAGLLNELSTLDTVRTFEKTNCFINHFIHNETLEADLLAALEKSGIEVTDAIRSQVQSKPRSNTSSKRHGTAYFYDAASEALVATRDRLIIDKFEYVPPSQSQRGP